MEKSLRCTVCTWRGSWAEAAAVRVQPRALDESAMQLQAMYEEKQAEEERLGGHRVPTCPACGHHTLPVKLHRSAAL
jgi:hypothetical protein